jgi:hypothetical protein
MWTHELLIYLDINKTFVKCDIREDRLNQQLIAYEKF